MEVFTLHPAKNPIVPIVISSPHSGTYFPDEVKESFLPNMIDNLDDTDWFIPMLYDWAPDLGITVIEANISRWVIDLNRNPNNQSLYNDGRLITDLCPTSNFVGDALYKEGKEPDTAEIERRKEAYFYPYYNKIQEQLDSFKQQFGQVLLYDAHSIRAVVSTIRKEKFPDLILGTADGKSASKELIDIAKTELSKGTYHLSYNDPFKGGNITRHFGKPELNQHAIQLERCKNLYMDDSEEKYHLERANKMKTLLQSTFKAIIKQMQP